MRRVKCDLKSKMVPPVEGVEPTCSNCAARGMRCVNEFERNPKGIGANAKGKGKGKDVSRIPTEADLLE